MAATGSSRGPAAESYGGAMVTPRRFEVRVRAGTDEEFRAAETFLAARLDAARAASPGGA